MTEKKAIGAACALGAVILLLMIIIIRPFSRFEEQYPMADASGVSGGSVSGAGMSVNADADSPGDTVADVTNPSSGDNASSTPATSDSVTGIPLVHASGNTLESRVDVPAGFTRTTEDEGSLGAFLRGYKLKKDGSPVHLYNKELKSDQNAHVAVFALPLEKEDLQQCADSVMRVYAEYFRSQSEESRISFTLSDGFKASYQRWREGMRIIESGDSFEYVDRAEFDGSDATYKKFMRIVFAYAGTYSLETDSKKVKKLSSIKIGDIFLQAGSPGHVVMVVDTCEDESGRKAFLLAQGYMPAQQFHLLKNPAHDDDPWYYVDEVSFPFKTPEYTFDKMCLRRPMY